MINKNPQDHTRNDILADETDFANDVAWTDRQQLIDDHRLNKHEQAFLDYIAHIQRTWQAIHLGKTYQITPAPNGYLTNSHQSPSNDSKPLKNACQRHGLRFQ